MIERYAEKVVNEWIENGKEAFLLTGARQIGKTYLTYFRQEIPHF